jgi:hypothetical protein
MNNKHQKTIVSAIILLFAILACGAPSPREKPVLFPSPTSNATQTPIIYTSTPQPTYTPLSTQTPEIIVVIATSTLPSTRLCVIADEAVYLRPSASDDGYPITPLLKGSVLTDLGGRNGNWAFVQFDDKTGYANLNWLGECDS